MTLLQLIAYLVATAAVAILAVLIVADWLAIRGRRARFRDLAPDADVIELNKRIAMRRVAEAAKRPSHTLPRGAA